MEVAIEWVEAQPPHRARERVERAAHVHRLGGHEHPHRWRQRQHATTARRTRVSAGSSKRASTSTVNCPAWIR